MIYQRSKLNVIDNTGGKKVYCINIKGKSYRSYAEIGDLLLVSMKKISRKNKVKVGSLYTGVVVGRKRKMKRFGDFSVFFNLNLIVILGANNLPLGTRILGPVCKELRKKRFLKIISLAPLII